MFSISCYLYILNVKFLSKFLYQFIFRNNIEEYSFLQTLVNPVIYLCFGLICDLIIIRRILANQHMAHIIYQKLYTTCIYVCIYTCKENCLKRSCFSEQICAVKLFQACFNMLEGFFCEQNR